jgi:hypothetical protein
LTFADSVLWRTKAKSGDTVVNAIRVFEYLLRDHEQKLSIWTVEVKRGLAKIGGDVMAIAFPLARLRDSLRQSIFELM